MNSKRPWDPEHKYARGRLKEYKYWSLEVSYRQHTFGNYIIFSREEVERISELSNEAVLELKTVMQAIEHALRINDTFNPDRFNYWQMGNTLHWLHLHGIPRYKSSRQFANRKWTDETWGAPPVWSKVEVSDELVSKIRDAIRESL